MLINFFPSSYCYLDIELHKSYVCTFVSDVALHRPADIRPVLASYQGRDIAREFIERSKEHQR